MFAFKNLKRIGVMFLVLALSISFSGCFSPSADDVDKLLDFGNDDMTYTDQTVSIPQAAKNISNYRQKYASVGLFAHDGELYFVFYGGDNAPKNMGKLGVLRDGQAQFFSGLQRNFSKTILWEGSAYYSWASNGISRQVLCRFDLQSDETTELVGRPVSLDGSPYFGVGCDGVLYYVDDQELATGYPILGETAGELTDIPGTYELDGSIYSGNWVLGSTLSKTAPDGTVTEVPLGEGESWFLPYKDGILAMNLTKGNILHYIDKNGTITELFSNECGYGKMAVNSWEDYVFVSIQRYEKYSGNSRGEPYEKDTESGTYRIDMKDLSVEKISDHVYDGLYIFSEGEIFACDKNSNVDKLDFDGKLLLSAISS